MTQKWRMIYPRTDAWQEAGQGIEPRTLMASAFLSAVAASSKATS